LVPFQYSFAPFRTFFEFLPRESSGIFFFFVSRNPSLSGSMSPSFLDALKDVFLLSPGSPPTVFPNLSRCNARTGILPPCFLFSGSCLKRVRDHSLLPSTAYHRCKLPEVTSLKQQDFPFFSSKFSLRCFHVTLSTKGGNFHPFRYVFLYRFFFCEVPLNLLDLMQTSFRSPSLSLANLLF